MRPLLVQLPAGCDLLIRAQPRAAGAQTSQLAAELERLLGRLSGSSTGGAGKAQDGPLGQILEDGHR